MGRAKIQIKRIYEAQAAGDGKRVLVDPLWPRGVSKQNAKLDLWLKEIAPSTELRKWFNHDSEKWDEFKSRYREELKVNSGPLQTLSELSREGPLTLLYAARDQKHNEAQVLKAVLEEHS